MPSEDAFLPVLIHATSFSFPAALALGLQEHFVLSHHTLPEHLSSGARRLHELGVGIGIEFPAISEMALNMPSAICATYLCEVVVSALTVTSSKYLPTLRAPRMLFPYSIK